MILQVKPKGLLDRSKNGLWNSRKWLFDDNSLVSTWKPLPEMRRVVLVLSGHRVKPSSSSADCSQPTSADCSAGFFPCSRQQTSNKGPCLSCFSLLLFLLRAVLQPTFTPTSVFRSYCVRYVWCCLPSHLCAAVSSASCLTYWHMKALPAFTLFVELLKGQGDTWNRVISPSGTAVV